jgi:spore coat protein CotH
MREALIMFDESRVHEVRIQMSEADWQSILDDSRGDELRNATVEIDGVTVTNVGIRPAGESSRVPGNAKMSMRVEFEAFSKKPVGGFDEIKLTGSWDDPFIVRDRLGYWVYRQVMNAPRIVPTRLAVNGQDRGIYEIEEVWGKEALKERFAEAGGPLYRIRGLTNMDPYEYKGPDAALYVPLPWDPKGMREPAEHAIIGETLRVIAEEPQRIGDVMDVDTLLTYFAVSAVVSNTDGFTGPFEVDDHFQYHDPVSGKFVILPWDPDNTFGSINDLPDADIFLNYERSVVTRMVSQGQLREPFLAKLEEVMQKIPAEAIQQQVDKIAGEIRPIVELDTTKMYPTSSFEWSIGYVKDWTAARYVSLADQIARKRAGEP